MSSSNLSSGSFVNATDIIVTSKRLSNMLKLVNEGHNFVNDLREQLKTFQKKEDTKERPFEIPYKVVLATFAGVVFTAYVAFRRMKENHEMVERLVEVDECEHDLGSDSFDLGDSFDWDDFSNLDDSWYKMDEDTEVVDIEYTEDTEEKFLEQKGTTIEIAVAAAFALSAFINLMYSHQAQTQLETLKKGILDADLDNEFNELDRLFAKAQKSIGDLSRISGTKRNLHQMRSSAQKLHDDLRDYQEKIVAVYGRVSEYYKSAADLRDKSVSAAIASLGMTLSGFIGACVATGGCATGIFWVGSAWSLVATGMWGRTFAGATEQVEKMNAYRQKLQKHREQYEELRDEIQALCARVDKQLDKQYNALEEAEKQAEMYRQLLLKHGISVPK